MLHIPSSNISSNSDKMTKARTNPRSSELPRTNVLTFLCLDLRVPIPWTLGTATNGFRPCGARLDLEKSEIAVYEHAGIDSCIRLVSQARPIVAALNT
jgi:hypothetical protein